MTSRLPLHHARTVRDGFVTAMSLSHYAVEESNKPPLADVSDGGHQCLVTLNDRHADHPMPTMQAHFPVLRRRMSRVRIKAPARYPVYLGAADSFDGVHTCANRDDINGETDNPTGRGTGFARSCESASSRAGGCEQDFWNRGGATLVWPGADAAAWTP